MKIAVAGGGTGGHIYPAVAVVDCLRRMQGRADVVFIGTKRGMEGGIVARQGYRMRWILSRPLPSGRNADFVYSLCCAFVGLIQSLLILVFERPSVVIGTGGYASAPVVVGARLLGIPIVLIEPNSVPGRTIMLLSRFADEVALGFRESIQYFRKGTNLRVTGVPVRTALLDCDREEGMMRFDLDGNRKTVFVFGGSRGASSINRAVVDAARALGERSDLQLLVQTGKRDCESVSGALASLDLPSRVRPFIEDMGLAYAVADLVVCRAGAGAVAEITACGLPSILIPYPYATASHQESNARLLERAGAALVILDDELDGKILADAIVSILSTPQRMETMSRSSRNLGRREACNEIASRVIGLCAKKGRLSKLATVLGDLCSVR